MTFTAAVASGAAADRLDQLLSKTPPGRAATVVRHAGLAVAHVTGSPWVSSFDDGEVLVVVDGRIHGLPTVRARPCRAMRSSATAPRQLIWPRGSWATS